MGSLVPRPRPLFRRMQGEPGNEAREWFYLQFVSGLQRGVACDKGVGYKIGSFLEACMGEGLGWSTLVLILQLRMVGTQGHQFSCHSQVQLGASLPPGTQTLQQFVERLQHDFPGMKLTLAVEGVDIFFR